MISGWLIIVLFSSFLCRKFYPEEKELSRKVVHIGTGPVIPLAWWFNISSSLVIALACIITIALFINHRIQLVTSIEDVGRKSYGTIAYGFSISVLIILFWSNNPSAVTAGVLVMAFGDGLAGLIGRKVQSPSWIILGQKKSLIGTIIMGATGVIILFILNEIIGAHLPPIDILTITSLAVVLEQISPLGVDNISVPIAVGVTWHLMLLD